MSHTQKDPLQKRIEVHSWILLGAAAALSAVFFSSAVALGVFAGGLISILNYYWLYRSLRKALSGGKSRAFVMLRYYIRFGVTAVIVYLLITKTPANIFALLFGLSIVVVSILGTTLLEFTKKNNMMLTKEVN